jgi:hypothetical protein
MFREAVISSGRAGIGETPIFAEGSIREPLWNDRCWRKAVIRQTVGVANLAQGGVIFGLNMALNEEVNVKDGRMAASSPFYSIMPTA